MKNCANLCIVLEQENITCRHYWTTVNGIAHEIIIHHQISNNLHHQKRENNNNLNQFIHRHYNVDKSSIALSYSCHYSAKNSKFLVKKIQHFNDNLLIGSTFCDLTSEKSEERLSHCNILYPVVLLTLL